MRSPHIEGVKVNKFRTGSVSLSAYLYAFFYCLQSNTFGHFWRYTNIAAQTHAVNSDINEAEVRLINSDGSQLGIVSSERALELAEEQDLDLVMIAPQAKPPVCKIMDYGKYRFEQQKREKEASKKQKVVEVKEIRLSLNIDTHDFETKLGHAKKFIAEGNRIKASIRLRGREMAHASRGYEVMERFAEALNEVAGVDKPAKLEGRSIQMFMSPQKPKSK